MWRWLLLASAAFAGSVQAITISPVLIELSTARRIVSVTVSNPSEQAMSFQAETLAWSQADGTDHYQPTEDLLIAPPIAEIAPQSSQIFRVALRRPLSATVEQTYRLVLEDVSKELHPQPGDVAIRFKHNLPVYVTPAGEAKAAPRWSRCAAAAGKGCVRLDNAGNHRLRVSELTVAGQGWQQKIPGGAVLAGAWKQFNFDLATGRSPPDSITANTDQGEMSANLSAR
ncbi:fimbrial biogenesis chaperone [Candidatus Methylobacter favarea]|uniref:fimbrial biogenesis chaperone n=1 Tax=Candidatus Methylobacter favarea TaxID=2707345 RepID=UPI00157E1596|nr:fimbria/pilus periplasmic chaperone [Candidatus Methylobacter favarea]